MTTHSVEKIGGTSMSDYAAVRDNIIMNPVRDDTVYQRIFVVSAYGGVTNDLLEHKKSGKPGIFSLFASGEKDDGWQEALNKLRSRLHDINAGLFEGALLLNQANAFIDERLQAAEECLLDLQRLCRHGHFSLEQHLNSVREMLSSIGEVHSAWNTAQLLRKDGINAIFVDLSGWKSGQNMNLDQRIEAAFRDIDLSSQMPIVTGYAQTDAGLMATFNRGYSEMTFSRIAVVTGAAEAVIHKEFHLSSADPRLVGAENAVPIGRTNYDVADQLANLGMEAIHPKAAKGLRESDIPLRVKNTFEPDHAGTTLTADYVSSTPRVEIIAGCTGIYALELFDQNMVGQIDQYDREVLAVLRRFRAQIISKDINANTITHYLAANLKTMKRIRRVLEQTYPDAEFNQRKSAIVSAIGSDMQVPGILAKAVSALAEQDINVQAMHQSMRQVDMQFIVDERDYEAAVKSLHRGLIEIHDHGTAICAAQPLVVAV
ncbi:MAG: aspartate kinase [Gammaproteobacteria bacterium]|nr:aspartate kinase [Pseudomonadales bacterium]MCP5347322.1 aspartate kinase [Pseudomonadales bacterium]